MALRGRLLGLLAILGVACVPILTDWLRHLASHSWTWASLAFPPLVAWLTARTRPGPARVAPALLLAAVGALAIVWALVSGSPRLGRPGLLLAVAGILLLFGRLRPRVAVLLALCLPFPAFLLERIAAPLLPPLAAVLASVLSVTGPAQAFGGLGDTPRQALAFLEPADVGLPVALLAGGLRWAQETLGMGAVGPALVRCAAAALLGVALQVVITLAWLWTGAASDATRPFRDLAVLGLVAIVIAGLGRGAAPERRASGATATAAGAQTS